MRELLGQLVSAVQTGNERMEEQGRRLEKLEARTRDAYAGGASGSGGGRRHAGSSDDGYDSSSSSEREPAYLPFTEANEHYVAKQNLLSPPEEHDLYVRLQAVRRAGRR